MTAEDFRRLALGMQDVIERSHMGHPDFRVNGRIFATLHSQDRFGMVWLTPEEQREFVRRDPEAFEPSSGAWGRQGCTNVRLSLAEEPTVRSAMILAWQRVSAMPPSKRSRSKTSRAKTSRAKAPRSRKSRA
jgi:hypothetical protein